MNTNTAKTILSNKQQQFLDEFFLEDTKRYIYGINQYADSIYDALKSKGLDIEAFVDDFTKDKEYKNKPIIKKEDLKEGKVVVVVTCNTLIALQKLESLNNDNLDFMDYFAFQKYSPLELEELRFWDSFIPTKGTMKDFCDDFNNNRNEYEEIYNKLVDEESKRHFEAIINFRLSQQYSFIRNLKIEPKKQYFDDFIDFSKIDTFFDLGGYEGETSLDFIEKNPNYKHIYFFEPFKESFEKAKTNLAHKQNISFFNLAIAQKKETLYFSKERQNMSNFLSTTKSQHSTTINVDNLDNLYNQSKIIMGGGESHKNGYRIFRASSDTRG